MFTITIMTAPTTIPQKDAGKYITQLSDIQHDYIFRDESGNTLAAIRLFPANEDEF